MIFCTSLIDFVFATYLCYVLRAFHLCSRFLICLYQAGKIVKEVYSVVPVYDKIVPALLHDGVWNLSKTCNFTPGVPIGPMLAKPATGVSEIIDKFQDMVFTCEYKYDGERAQVISVYLFLISLIILGILCCCHPFRCQGSERISSLQRCFVLICLLYADPFHGRWFC